MPRAPEPAPRPTFSLVIETANVAAGGEGLAACLRSIFDQGATLDEANEIVLLVEETAPPAAVTSLCDAYPMLHVEIVPNATYAAMKAHAAAVTSGEIVVFADSDCLYPPGWLSALLEPFVDSGVAAVTGETAVAIRGPYSLAVAVAFNFPGFTGEETIAASARYWANNVALRREALTNMTPANGTDLRRGTCVVHAAALVESGARIVRQPAARSLHATIPPREFVGRFLELGRDRARLDRHGAGSVPAFPPDREGDSATVKIGRRLVRAVKGRPGRLLMLPLALPVVGAAAVLHTVGRHAVR